MMKYLKLLALFICVTGFSQNSKVGTIDIDFILSKMPELANVQTQVQTYTKGLEADLQKKMKALKDGVAVYKQNETTYTLNQRKTKQDSLLAMENDIAKFQQNGNQLILIKQEEYMRPLYDKVGNALEKVAAAGEYTQVLLRDDSVVYVDNRFDLTLAVLKEMGIEIKEEE
ncbi:OmpH family outer membrane protein [Aureisphaera sp. CAU 1614]|uniref:OmpH family outer membrane protein n=2 Tax=Halomarinibacterium sedimenti TaxID=2857106 RepID=A0A9X1FPR3_9FLAO|nr:OmpH family outer membrane protein [Halomarinibacterium sedimenti]